MKKFFKNSFVLLLAVMMAASFLGCTPGTGNTQGTGNTPGVTSPKVEKCVLKFSGVTSQTVSVYVYRKASDESEYTLRYHCQLSSWSYYSPLSYPMEYSFTDEFVEPNKAYEYKYKVFSKSGEEAMYVADHDGEKVFIPSEGFGELSTKGPYPTVTYDAENKKLLFSGDVTVDLPSNTKSPDSYKKAGLFVFCDNGEVWDHWTETLTEVGLDSLINYYVESGTHQIIGYSIFLKFDGWGMPAYPQVYYLTNPIDISSKNITFTKE